MIATDRQLKSCLWLLDSGIIENAARAIRETDLFPDHFAAGIILEARRLFPSVNDKSLGDAQLEEQISQALNYRQNSGQALRIQATDVAKLLGEEINDENSSRDPEHFNLIRRLLTTAQSMAKNDGSVAPLVGEKGLYLDSLVERLNAATTDAQVEGDLRSKLYDENGILLPVIDKAFTRFPFVRQLVQQSIDTDKLTKTITDSQTKTIIDSLDTKYTAIISSMTVSYRRWSVFLLLLTFVVFGWAIWSLIQIGELQREVLALHSRIG
ncbi:MAG: hypothetical protein JWM11_5310 [Planctomycetaceae bacterium]|nr:hypothetical protein [Planctomycetaceae bacterium]